MQLKAADNEMEWVVIIPVADVRECDVKRATKNLTGCTVRGLFANGRTNSKWNGMGPGRNNNWCHRMYCERTYCCQWNRKDNGISATVSDAICGNGTYC